MNTNRCIKQILGLLFFLVFQSGYGQNKVEMADQFRADGKIYVVVAIVLIVLAGLIFYLFLMDQKVKKLSKMVSDKKKQTN